MSFMEKKYTWIQLKRIWIKGFIIFIVALNGNKLTKPDKLFSTTLWLNVCSTPLILVLYFDSQLDEWAKSMTHALRSTQQFTSTCQRFKSHFMLIQLLHHLSGKLAGKYTRNFIQFQYMYFVYAYLHSRHACDHPMLAATLGQILTLPSTSSIQKWGSIASFGIFRNFFTMVNFNCSWTEILYHHQQYEFQCQLGTDH